MTNPFQDGETVSAAILNATVRATDNQGVLDGVSVDTGTGSWEVDIGSGEVLLPTGTVDVSAQTVETDSSATDDRFDLVTIDDSGDASVTVGTDLGPEDGKPRAPDIPGGEVLVSGLYVRGGSSSLLSGDIRDEFRVPITNTIPSGIITMWSGSVGEIPTGWALCDGTDGTPDLQDRFVVGAGDSYDVDDTGGSEAVSLDEGELAPHDHDDGNLDVSIHTHDSGSLSGGSHSHSTGGLSISVDGEHDHGLNWTVAGVDDDGTFEVVRDIVASGGESGVTEEDGSHSHDIDGSLGSESVDISGDTGSSEPGVNGNTGSTGSGDPHENRPPYYALAYIMRL